MKIFDIGTNHGHFTEEYIGLYPDIQIVCIEANPTLCAYLVNKFKHLENVNVYHYLVSKKSNEYIDLIDGTFLPDMIKIDVEGYENMVIRGLTKKVDLIQFEWAEEEMESVKDSCNYLKSIGYNQFAYKFGDRPYSYIPTEYYSLENLGLFEQLITSRKDKWGMLYAK